MSDLRHKTPEQLRDEIKYQEWAISAADYNIKSVEGEISAIKDKLEKAEKQLGEYRMKRNNHHQRMVWAKNYLLIKNSD